MRIPSLLSLTGLFLVFAACAAEPQSRQQQQADSPPPLAFRPTATVKDLMDSVIDPNADFIWDSVATTVSAAGIEDKAPRTDEEWKEVRRHTIALLEASNLLLVPDRHIARLGEKAEDPKVELSPEQIESMIKQDRATWVQHALELHDAVMPSLNAIDAKDTEALLNSGELIDRACESCHLKYWYPNDQQAQRVDGQPNSQ